ncbi:MAG: class F sortase [Anaerolineae bacterium]|nr:class F sortase [Anaerolineae bacterium]
MLRSHFSRRLWLILTLIGAILLTTGAGMRAYAQITMRQTEQHLLASVPTTIATASISFPRASGVPTRLSLPSLDLWNALTPVMLADTPSGLAWQVADAGWYINSGVPGEGHNVVIAGHSPSAEPSTWSHSVFRQLAYLQPDDRIELTSGARSYHYTVAHVFAIPAAQANDAASQRWLQSGDSERLTLITCWPPHTAAYRVIVIAIPSQVS